MINHIIVPIVDSEPPISLAGPIQNLANFFAREVNGQIKELWVDRVIYDQITAEIMRYEEYSDRPKDKKWTNGLIILHTANGKLKIRLADED
jgi:hypothetical protein